MSYLEELIEIVSEVGDFWDALDSIVKRYDLTKQEVESLKESYDLEGANTKLTRRREYKNVFPS